MSSRTTFGELSIGDEFIVFTWSDTPKMKIPNVVAEYDGFRYNTVYLSESEEYLKGAIVRYGDDAEVFKIND